MTILENIVKELNDKSHPEKIDGVSKFFKAFKGGYGEGDKFLSVTNPEQKKIAQKYFKDISLEENEKLLQSSIHEHRQTALYILVKKYQKEKDPTIKDEIVKIYLRSTKYINNWDLVDSSAQYILGESLKANSDRNILYKLAKSSNLWEQRISIIATLQLIRDGQFEDTLKIAEILLNHDHDLIHKAVGWMLREVGNKNINTEEDFLKTRYKTMPRTMLRYAIEKFPEEKRQKYLKGEI